MGSSNPSTDATVRGHLELLVLAALSTAPSHGYALLTSLRELCDGTFDLTEGSLYPVLHKLEDAGLVRSKWDQTTGRRRRVYELTTSGRQELNERARRWAAVRDAVDSVLATIERHSAAANRRPTDLELGHA